MKQNPLPRLAIMITLLIVAGIACNFSFSTANVGEAYTARDEDGNQKTKTFAPTDTFYVVAELKNAPDDTVIKAVWIAVEVDGVEANTELGDYEVEGGSGEVTFSFSNENPWAEGRYKVEIYVNENREKTLEFEVALADDTDAEAN